MIVPSESRPDCPVCGRPYGLGRFDCPPLCDAPLTQAETAQARAGKPDTLLMSWVGFACIALVVATALAAFVNN